MRKTSIVMFIYIIINIFCPTGISMAADDLASNQAQALGLSQIAEDFINKTNEVFPDFDVNKVMEEVSKGNLNFNSKGLIKRVIGLFANEIYINAQLIIKVIIIAVLCAILKTLQENFSGRTSEIAFYACYLLMITFVIAGFKEAIQLGHDAVFDMVGFMQAIIPVIISMMISMGNVASSGMMYSLLITLVGVLGTVIGTFIIPAVFLSAVLSMVGNISDKIQLSKVGGIVRTVSIWVMGILLTIFAAIVSAHAGLGGTIDGVTGKAIKFAFSKSVPFVGQILSDSVETVLGCSLIVKNALGIIGVIILIGIVLIPLIKILAMAFMYKIAAVVVQPLAEDRITKCLEDIGGTLILLFSIVVSVGFMFIVGITALIRTGNIAYMIR